MASSPSINCSSPARKQTIADAVSQESRGNELPEEAAQKNENEYRRQALEPDVRLDEVYQEIGISEEGGSAQEVVRMALEQVAHQIAIWG